MGAPDPGYWWAIWLAEGSLWMRTSCCIRRHRGSTMLRYWGGRKGMLMSFALATLLLAALGVYSVFTTAIAVHLRTDG
jgi:hypothetical protein